MADNWNIAGVEPLNDTNYFLWRKKVEVLRSKKLWKKIMGVKLSEKPLTGEAEYENSKYGTNGTMGIIRPEQSC